MCFPLWVLDDANVSRSSLDDEVMKVVSEWVADDIFVDDPTTEVATGVCVLV